MSGDFLCAGGCGAAVVASPDELCFSCEGAQQAEHQRQLRERGLCQDCETAPAVKGDDYCASCLKSLLAASSDPEDGDTMPYVAEGCRHCGRALDPFDQCMHCDTFGTPAEQALERGQ
ncbi:hypothetical protein [Deinococcus multiflagellatus]|uniref:DZANK-type domain-containing protein n=1 Tax=Deinococcus multiflagellatus TaxID=1656887 RepID=A0ABW1ZPP1_9DEIO|nr:hypothetical protein [Deinococcus multiflagellatus]MBZ9715333.1 hypothetical protein [Deinococcus multiflagellatus]